METPKQQMQQQEQSIPPYYAMSLIKPDSRTKLQRLWDQASFTFLAIRFALSYLIAGPKLPTWSLKMHLAVHLARHTFNNSVDFTATDDVLKNPDAVREFIAAHRSLAIVRNPTLPHNSLLGEFRLAVEGPLLDAPDPVLAELAELDARACSTGTPRHILGEVMVADSVVKHHLAVNSNSNLYDICPIAQDGDEYVLIDFHGGAYLGGSPISNRKIAARVSAQTGLRVIVPDYRLSPEHKFPAQLHDAYIIWQALVLNGFKPSHIFIFGDSAGGNLCLALILLLKRLGQPLPKGAILLSPWVEVNSSRSSHYDNDQFDFIPPTPTQWPFSPARLLVAPGQPLNKDILGMFTNPLISPIYGDFSGCPPLLIHVGGKEMMHDDICEFACRVKKQQSCHEDKAGHPLVKLEIYEDMPHVFHLFDFTDAAAMAYASIGDFTCQLIAGK